jgi:hypothetical protein
VVAAADANPDRDGNRLTKAHRKPDRDGNRVTKAHGKPDRDGNRLAAAHGVGLAGQLVAAHGRADLAVAAHRHDRPQRRR